MQDCGEGAWGIDEESLVVGALLAYVVACPCNANFLSKLMGKTLEPICDCEAQTLGKVDLLKAIEFEKFCLVWLH